MNSGKFSIVFRPKLVTRAMQIALSLSLITVLWLSGSEDTNAQNQPGNQPVNTNNQPAANNQNANQNQNQNVDRNDNTLPNITKEDVLRANFGMRRSGEGIQFEILNDFENCEDWRAASTSPLGETRVRKLEGKPDNQAFDQEKQTLEKFKELTLKQRREAAIRFAKSNNTPPPNNQGTNDAELAKIASKYILGIKTYFKDRGFDRVEVAPPNEYIIKGRAKEIRVWTLGRKFRHTLYVKLRDYRGKLHKLKMGRLDFFGWKNMKVTVPGWLPQSSRYALLDKNLHFVSFFVVSDRFETPGTFYFYLDNFSIVTDVAENQYDGSEILDTW